MTSLKSTLVRTFSGLQGAFTFFSLALTLPTSAHAAPKGNLTIGELAQSSPQLSTLASLASLCAFDGFLNEPGFGITVFAPTNAAFSDLFGDKIPTECDDALQSVLLSHFVNGAVRSQDLTEKQAVPTYSYIYPSGDQQYGNIFITKSNGKIEINANSKVVTADVEASNGVVHIIDKVLIPDNQGSVFAAIAKRFQFTALTKALKETGIARALDEAPEVTLFAPTDAAFALLKTIPGNEVLSGVLKHHALGSKVLWSDVVADYRGPRTLNPITLNGDALNLFVNAPNRPNPTTPFPIDFVPSQVKIWGSGENVNEAGQIITIDLVAKNGVIHYVNEVLIPNAVVGAR